MIIEILVLAFLTAAGTLLQTITGFGGTILLVPVLLAYFNAPTSVTVSLLVADVICLLVLFAENRSREYSWKIVWRVYLFAIPGIVIGAFISTHTKKALLQVFIGLVVIAAALIQEYVFPKPKKIPELSQEAAVTGFSAGLLNAAAVLAAPPIVLWLRRAKAAKNVARDTMSILFILMNTTSIVIIHLLKPVALSSKGLWIFAILLPVILVVNWLSRQILPKIDSDHYHKFSFGLVLFVGVVNVVVGSLNLH